LDEKEANLLRQIYRASYLTMNGVELMMAHRGQKDFSAFSAGIPGATAEVVKEGIVKITVDGKAVNMKHLRFKTDLMKKEEYMWTAKLAYAIDRAGICFRELPETAFVAITFFIPVACAWDPDNYPVSHVINAVRYNHLVKDDSWKNITYMVMGEVDRKSPRTEITILYPEILGQGICQNVAEIVRAHTISKLM